MKTSSKLKLLGALLGAALLSATTAAAEGGSNIDAYGDKVYDHGLVYSETSMIVQEKSNSEISISKFNTNIS